MRRPILLLALVAILLITYTLTRPPRGPRPPQPAPIPNSALNAKTLLTVSQSYNTDVLPLFKRACMDCHSSATVFPWYHHVPGVAQWLDGHVAEARHDLDLSDGLPFNTDTPLSKHLRRISNVVKRGSMPLGSYKLMHPDSRLTDDERQVIVHWADDSLAQLSATAKAYDPMEEKPHAPGKP
jgi:hypothetical protein